MIVEIWDRPVEVSFDNGNHFLSVRNSREALACLMAKWPSKGGAHYARAKRTCLKTIETQAGSQAASEAFLEAARVAGVLRN
ncbi:DUF982 domain-containing protein [Pararhizobium arenae]|uniref:DUF982 domain-containing protein n=1 Tax=Pararhizobium arenae TaxID=1856850 RepID=UPI00094ABBCF|nr:DUF982 domain-containing protein [Pararhizobium arenae]